MTEWKTIHYYNPVSSKNKKITQASAKESPPRKSKRTETSSFYLWPFLLIIVFSFFLYANSLKNGFVYDDKITIIDSPLIKDINNLSSLFNEEYFEFSSEITYRPIVTFSYLLDHAIYGLAPWGYHLTNIIIHVMNGILLYMFLTYLMPLQINERSQSMAIQVLAQPSLLSSLLFASHPILTEAVNVVSYREDLLAFFFFIGTLNLYLILRKNDSSFRSLSSLPVYILSCFTFLFALLSKEMAVTLPLVIFFYEFIFNHEKERWKISISNLYNMGYIAIIFIYGYIRFYSFFNPAESSLIPWPLDERLLTIPCLLLNFIKLIIFPVSLSADYEIYPVKTFFSLRFILPIIMIVSFLSLPFIIKKWEKRLMFGLLFFLITLIPVYNVVPISNPLAERYLYLPVVGFIIGMGVAIDYALKNRNIKMGLMFLGVLIVYSVITVNRNNIWSDNFTLWKDTVRKMPNSSRVHNNLGVEYRRKGQLNEAMVQYEIAVSLDPNNADAHRNLALRYSDLGRFAEAIRELKEALSLNPESSEYHYQLGNVYYKQWRFEEAAEQYLQAISMNQNNLSAYNDLANAYYKLGRFNEALQGYQALLKSNPENPFYHYNLATVYEKLGRIDEAMQEYQITLRLKPDFAAARINLENIHNVGTKP